MSDFQPNIEDCHREPIHIPGAVQPHGALLALDATTLSIIRAGGNCEGFFGCADTDLLDRPLARQIPSAAGLSLLEVGAQPRYAGSIPGRDGRELDVIAHVSGGELVLEFEPAPERRISAAEMAQSVETHGAALTAARTIAELCDEAATRFRKITGFDRVMVYRFLPDLSGSVVSEDKATELPSFLNHRYPASDIPNQARALYVRNQSRVIPDVHYIPRPVVERSGLSPLDMSDCHLRSVSPVHIQYLKNMEVAAAASFSIVRDGHLWGLVACHHRHPSNLSFDQRMICRMVAITLSRQLASLEDAETFRSRVRTRTAEDALIGVLSREPSIEDALVGHVSELMSIVPAHGVAVRRKDAVASAGGVPPTAQITAIGDWLLKVADGPFFETQCLAERYAPAAAMTGVASGLLAVTISAVEPYQVLWFRGEQIEEVNWAGNPHKPVELSDIPSAPLTPRRSFETWCETVRGKSEPWSVVNMEAAGRFARTFAELQRMQSLDRMNESLRDALAQRERLLSHREFQLREGDHRIQNSLQIVSGMLSMQLRETSDPSVRAQLEEAATRVQAVGLVHRRLHKSVEPSAVEVDAYVTELTSDLGKTLGDTWAKQMRVHTSPVSGPTDVAIAVGLALTELVLNAVKYAYGGKPGPLEIDLQMQSDLLRLSVRDWGAGSKAPTGGTGLGTRLILRLLESLDGSMRREDAAPGLRVVINVPLRS